MSHLIEIKTDVFKEKLSGYIYNDDFDKIQSLFYKSRKRYEKTKPNKDTQKEKKGDTKK